MNRKCQVFTPKDYVKKLLDIVGYTNNLYGKKMPFFSMLVLSFIRNGIFA